MAYEIFGLVCASFLAAGALLIIPPKSIKNIGQMVGMCLVVWGFMLGAALFNYQFYQFQLVNLITSFILSVILTVLALLRLKP